MYMQKGGIKISVVSRTGKEAVVAILGPGDFFGKARSRVNRFGSGRQPRRR
jgi:CRP-like cAMP-binding protein